MRLRVLLPGICAAAAILPASASADFVHTVLPGESLFAIAAQDGLSVGQVAAANGLAADSTIYPGQNIAIPPRQGAASTPSYTSSSTASSTPTYSSTASAAVGDGDSDSDDVGSTPTASTGSRSTGSSAAATGAGGYVVQPGDTLSGLAARLGTTVGQLAAANGLNPNGILYAGSQLRLSGGSPSAATRGYAVPVSSSSAAQEPVGTAAQGSVDAPPYPTPERLSASQIGSIGASNGSPASLTDAIAWQESGFNNDLVSSADARGIMQILPGTWQWIRQELAAGGPPLAPASATDNVRGGSLMLRWLLNQTAGNPAMAAAGYYQGLSSVQRYGLYPSTQQYINSVMALRQQFGGG